MLDVLILALASSAIALTITLSSIFENLRRLAKKKNEWLGELVRCPYCLSHWVALVFVVVYRPVLVEMWLPIDLIVSWFVVVAITAIISGIITTLLPFKALVDDNTGEIVRLREALQGAANFIEQQKKGGKNAK